MSEDRYLLELLQQTDEKMIYQAGQPWEQGKHCGRGFRGRLDRDAGRPGGAAGRRGIRAAGVLLAVTVGMGAIFHEQVTAAIGQFKTQIAAWMENERDFSPYTEVVNQTQTVNGVSMTLKEVVLNTNRVTAMVEVRWEDGEKIPENTMVYFGSVAINGEYMESAMSSNYNMENGVYMLEDLYGDGQIPEEISTVELMIRYGQPDKEREGFWEDTAAFDFSFKASRSDLVQQMKTIPLDFDLELSDGLKLHFEELEASDSASRIQAVCSRDPRSFYKDESGESYDLLDYGLMVEDDKGNSQGYSSTGYDEETGVITFDSYYGTPPDGENSYLDIELYKMAGTYAGEPEGQAAEQTETQAAEQAAEQMEAQAAEQAAEQMEAQAAEQAAEQTEALPEEETELLPDAFKSDSVKTRVELTQ